MLKQLYKLDHLYGLLLTFGVALIIQGAVPQRSTARPGCPTRCPHALSGGHNLGFMFLPNYRAWVIVVLARRVPRAPGT